MNMEPSIICPQCWRESFNVTDIQNGYCGACHDFTAPPELFGPVILDRYAMIAKTGYWKFVSRAGIDGLMKWKDGRLDLLAIFTANPGTGQFREFIKEAKLISSTIFVWHIFNPTLGKILFRYGFKPVVETFKIQDREDVAKGVRWDAKN